MQRFRNLFKHSQMKCSIIGMIHLNPLPGTPKYRDGVDKIVTKACKETEIYLKNGINGVLVENMHDIPYVQSNNFQPETVAIMSRVCNEIRRIAPPTVPCGIQVLACGNREAIAIAKACNFDFIRAEGYVFSHIADEGFTNADAGRLLRYRRSIDADNVLIFTDIKKKHSSHAITSDLSLLETAEAAEFFLSDGLILTGTSTGKSVDLNDFNQIVDQIKLPLLIGSGVNIDNFNNYYCKADGLIIGSYFKQNGKWINDLDENRVKEFMLKIQQL